MAASQAVQPRRRYRCRYRLWRRRGCLEGCPCQTVPMWSLLAAGTCNGVVNKICEQAAHHTWDRSAFWGWRTHGVQGWHARHTVLAEPRQPPRLPPSRLSLQPPLLTLWPAGAPPPRHLGDPAAPCRHRHGISRGGSAALMKLQTLHAQPHKAQRLTHDFRAKAAPGCNRCLPDGSQRSTAHPLRPTSGSPPHAARTARTR